MKHIIAWMKKWHWIHSWTKWETVNVTYTGTGKMYGQRWVRPEQLRTCSVCGLKESNDIF